MATIRGVRAVKGPTLVQVQNLQGVQGTLNSEAPHFQALIKTLDISLRQVLQPL